MLNDFITEPVRQLVLPNLQCSVFFIGNQVYFRFIYCLYQAPSIFRATPQFTSRIHHRIFSTVGDHLIVLSNDTTQNVDTIVR